MCQLCDLDKEQIDLQRKIVMLKEADMNWHNQINLLNAVAELTDRLNEVMRLTHVLHDKALALLLQKKFEDEANQIKEDEAFARNL